MDTKRLEKYFEGSMSSSQKEELMHDLEVDVELKERFIEILNLRALNGFTAQEGDAKTAKSHLGLFESRIRRDKMRSSLKQVMRYAAVVAVAIVGTLMTVNIYSDIRSESLYSEIEVPQGHKVHVKLQDGTTIWLNSRSKLRYPDSFSGDTRNVFLDGEAFFDVAKDNEKPFIVKTSRYDVEVHGTKFTVFNYSQSPVFETTLLEGSVSVYKSDKANSAIRMNPNEQLVMRNGVLKKLIIENQDIKQWENLNFTFDDQPFEAIIHKLELYYDVKFVVRNEASLQTTYSGCFSMDDKLEDILNALQNVEKFSYSMSSDNKIVYID